jgi:hypothetical protein
MVVLRLQTCAGKKNRGGSEEEKYEKAASKALLYFHRYLLEGIEEGACCWSLGSIDQHTGCIVGTSRRGGDVTGLDRGNILSCIGPSMEDKGSRK